MWPSVKQALTTEWRPALAEAGLTLAEPLTALKAGGALAGDSKDQFFIFERGAARPTLLLKLAAGPQYAGRLRHEFEVLRAVWARLPRAAPCPLGLFTLNGALVLAEPCVPGTPLSVLLRRRQHRRPREVQRDLTAVFDWLADFQTATAAGQTEFSGRASVLARVDRLALARPDWSAPPVWLEALLTLAETYRGRPLPWVGQHGDFWPGNILLTADGVSVIDWENYVAQGEAFRDAFLFAVTYAQTYPWTGWHWTPKPEAFRRGFMEHNWLAAAVVAQLKRHLDRWHWPPAAGHLFFSLFLMEMATPETAWRGGPPEMWQAVLDLYAGQGGVARWD